MSITELLQRSVLFSGLTPEQLDQIATLSREATYNAGDVVIQEQAALPQFHGELGADGLAQFLGDAESHGRGPRRLAWCG